jgi:hypothetical protein
VRTLDRILAPAIAPGQYVLGPIRVDTTADGRGLVDQVVVLSPQATVDGHPLSDGYARLRRELAGWTAEDCHNAPYSLHQQSANGVSTWLYFAGRQLDQAVTGVVHTDSCGRPLA